MAISRRNTNIAFGKGAGGWAVARFGKTPAVFRLVAGALARFVLMLVAVV